MPRRKKSQEEYDQQLLALGTGVKRIEKFEGTKTQILHRCVCGDPWMTTPNNVLKGRRCGCYQNNTAITKPKWPGPRTQGGWSWSAQEDDFIKAHADNKTAEWIAEQLGRTEGAVLAQANKTLKISLVFSEKVCPDCGETFTRNNNAKYCKACSVKREKERERQGTWFKEKPELVSVRNHYGNIYNPKSAKHKNYKGMPFYDGWNPKKGGSFKTGAQWIIDNIGKRPKGSSLHVIHHDIGFMPGNLEWASPKKQNNQQMYKIIAQQRNRIKQLKRQLIEAQQVIALAA